MRNGRNACGRERPDGRKPSGSDVVQRGVQRLSAAVPVSSDDGGSTALHAPVVESGHRPLADRLRPRSLAEVIGQSQVLAPGRAVRRDRDGWIRGRWDPLIFWGPPAASQARRSHGCLRMRQYLHFVQISAIFSGVPELRKVF